MATLQTLPEATQLLPAAPAAGSGNLAARSFVYAVFKHKRLVLGVFLLVFLASAVVGLIRPTTWRATSEVLVKIGETLTLTPTEAPSHSYFQPLTPEAITTEGEIVKSRQVIEEAARRLGVQPEPGTSFAQMIDGMQLALTVAPTPSSNTLQISYIGRSPEKAARMVNAITEVYLEHHNEAYRNDQGLHSLYRQQLRLLEGQMKEAQHRLRAYLQKVHVTDVDQEIRIVNQDAIEQEKTLAAHRAKMRGAEKKLAALRALIEKTPPQIPFSEEYLSNPSVLQLKQRLTDLQIDRTKLLEQYLPTDRHVQQDDEQIAQLEQQIKREQEHILNKRTMQESEVHRELVRNAYTIEAQLADLREREPAVARGLEAMRERLRVLRDARFTINNLKQDADEKAYAFDLYWRKQEEARISQQLKNTNMVNVSVVQWAEPPTQPVNGLLLPLLLGLVGGLGLAAGLAVAVEYVSRRLRFEEEVERYLELPVLAVIPDLETVPAPARA
jgi:succinoglycan biosynthesis transport protein ExoP